jgi:hypothetical protein
VVVFLAGRKQIQIKRLHTRIKNRFQSDDDFGAVQLRVAGPREPGGYRVDAELDPREFLESYPATNARIEVGFELTDQSPEEYYWFNWIEPSRSFSLGWHRDRDHPEIGPVHLQVNQHDTAIDRRPATHIDRHPMAVLEARLAQLPGVVTRVRWDDGTVIGLDS